MFKLVLCSIIYVWCSAPSIRSQDQCLTDCKIIKPPTYMVLAPRTIRPMHVTNVMVTVPHIEFNTTFVRVSVGSEKVEYTANHRMFDAPGMTVIPLLLPSHATKRKYWLRVKGTVTPDSLGTIFEEERELTYDNKRASVFIQLSKPFYILQQTVKFRVIVISPNLMPYSQSVSVDVEDPHKNIIHRWQGQQLNAGGFVEMSFTLADRPAYGDWWIIVRADDYEAKKKFEVHEYWSDMFIVNVTVPVSITADVTSIGGEVTVNHTSGKAAWGNAEVDLTIVRKNEVYDYKSTILLLPPIKKKVEFFNGKFEFSYDRDTILTYAGALTMAGMEFHYNVSVTDWPLQYTFSGYGSTQCYAAQTVLKWVGDTVRSFKPDSPISATVAVENVNGAPLSGEKFPVTFDISAIGGGSIPPRVITPVNGYATLTLTATKQMKTVKITARSGYQRSKPLYLNLHYSPSNAYISVSTSTRKPRVNEYIIFHIRCSTFVPRVYYQIISKGKILLAEELLMISRQKTISVAVSRDMTPVARIVVFTVVSPNYVISDALDFAVQGVMNPMKIEFNKGKDFRLTKVGVKAITAPTSFAAFSAIPYDLYKRGLSDGISETDILDELLTYDQPSNSYKHKRKISESKYTNDFFPSRSHGIDAESTFEMAGLIVITDANLGLLSNKATCKATNQLPCHDGSQCYDPKKKCDGEYDCSDGADEADCEVKETAFHNRPPIDRISRQLWFYEDSHFAWKSVWIQSYGSAMFSFKMPPLPLTWVINGFSLHPDNGFGLVDETVLFDATRLVYIIVEGPSHAISGEQIGFRVTVFNYWFGDDFLEVLVKLHASKDYKFIHVEEYGVVNSNKPRTSFGEQQTLVYLEAGEAREIYIPVLPMIKAGNTVDVTISAYSYVSTSIITTSVALSGPGVTNYYFTPYLIDLVRKGSEKIPEVTLPIPSNYIVPEQRDWLYIPGTDSVQIGIFGDMITPGLFDSPITSLNTVGKPYDTAEMAAYNLAFNVLTLKYKRSCSQLSQSELVNTIGTMNVMYQRLLTYKNVDGSFHMFLYDESPSIWVTAFAASTLSEARFGDWEKLLFVPAELLTNVTQWLCRQQDQNGAFDPFDYLYDKKMLPKSLHNTVTSMSDPVTLTAYVVIALHKINRNYLEMRGVTRPVITAATHYLLSKIDNIKDGDIFQLNIVTYAVSLSVENNILYERMKKLQRVTPGGRYWSDLEIIPTPRGENNGLPTLYWRNESQSDAYAIATTAYGLLASLRYHRDIEERKEIVIWLQNMRNYFSGFSSTQDTIVTLEALLQYASSDRHRRVFSILLQPLITGSNRNKSDETFSMSVENYTQPFIKQLTEAWGYVKLTVQGTGRVVLGVTSTVNVKYARQILTPHINCFDLIDNITWGGRNYSVMYMQACARWHYASRSLRSGLSFIQIELPTSYAPNNDVLREYVKSHKVPNLKYADFDGRNIIFYFTYLDESFTCVNFYAERQHAVAGFSREHYMAVFDYYEPGLYNITNYRTVNLYKLNLCFACASYQCPYCPGFNAAFAFTSFWTYVLSIALCLLICTSLI